MVDPLPDGSDPPAMARKRQPTWKQAQRGRKLVQFTASDALRCWLARYVARTGSVRSEVFELAMRAWLARRGGEDRPSAEDVVAFRAGEEKANAESK